jgi:hypothetical protein
MVSEAKQSANGWSFTPAKKEARHSAGYLELPNHKLKETAGDFKTEAAQSRILTLACLKGIPQRR